MVAHYGSVWKYEPGHSAPTAPLTKLVMSSNKMVFDATGAAYLTAQANSGANSAPSGVYKYTPGQPFPTQPIMPLGGAQDLGIDKTGTIYVSAGYNI